VPTPGTEKTLEPRNFFVGAKLAIYGRLFTITQADSLAQEFMKEHPELWA
jgi:hypothetical protein